VTAGAIACVGNPSATVGRLKGVPKNLRSPLPAQLGKLLTILSCRATSSRPIFADASGQSGSDVSMKPTGGWALTQAGSGQNQSARPAP
jgi:hypothetical protein